MVVYLIVLNIFIKLVSTTITSTPSYSSKSTESSTAPSYEFGDRLEEDLRNIAYYLRQHKFNEYDRRYVTDQIEIQESRTYYAHFPKPPLRSLHWEVHKFCEPSFYECVAYLTKKIRDTALKRNDDTSVIVEDQKWFHNFTQQIKQTDIECKKMWSIGEEKADPFEGPLERFQWRVTASYFMCLYTMNRTIELKHLKEPSCDNYANCLNPYLGAHNFDIRAKDEVPFNCARFSFCPDPCCPILYIKSSEECWNSIENPCFAENEPDQRLCSFDMSANTEFTDMILNRWNVSCKCSQEGYKWSSFYGICVDIDECEYTPNRCKSPNEACINLPGSYKCVCAWGYSWNEKSKSCDYNVISETLLLRKESNDENDEDNSTESFLTLLFSKAKTKFSKNLSCKITAYSELWLVTWTLLEYFILI